MMFVSSVAPRRITSAASSTSMAAAVLAARDGEKDSPRPHELGVDQRRAERLLGRLVRPVLSGGEADSHQRRSRVRT